MRHAESSGKRLTVSTLEVAASGIEVAQAGLAPKRRSGMLPGVQLKPLGVWGVSAWR